MIFPEGKHALLILNIDQHVLIGLRYIDTRYLWEYEIQNVIDKDEKIKHQEEKHALLILNIDQHLLIGLRCIDTRYLWKYEMHNVIDTHEKIKNQPIDIIRYIDSRFNKYS